MPKGFLGGVWDLHGVRLKFCNSAAFAEERRGDGSGGKELIPVCVCDLEPRRSCFSPFSLPALERRLRKGEVIQ